MNHQTIKTKTEDLLDCFWSAGFNSAYTVIEQISNLIFMRFLEEQHDKGNQTIYLSAEDALYRWSNFRSLEENELFLFVKNQAIPFLKSVQLSNPTLRLLQAGIELQLSDGYLLKRAINLIDDLYEIEINSQVSSIAEAYELLLSGINENLGRNGQYVTPRHIVEVIVQLIEPSMFETIFDPVCGSGGFLVYAHRLFKCSNLKGYDLDPIMTRVAAINLLLHGVEKPIIQRLDTTEDSFNENESDIIFMNPPFGIRNQNQDKNNKNQNDTVSEKKYIRLALKFLKENGRGAAIVPDGILYGTGHRDLRQELIDNGILEGVISLPSGAFRPFTGAKTSIILFSKNNIVVNKQSNFKVWYYEVKSDGFSLDDRRSVLPSSNRNDLDDILNRWKSREQDWKLLLESKDVINQPIELATDSRVLFVPIESIINNDYDLSLSTYRKFNYEILDLEEPSSILEKIFKIEEELNSSLLDLDNALTYEIDENEFHEKLVDYNEHISIAEQEKSEESKPRENKLDFSGLSFFMKNLSKKQKEFMDVFVKSEIPLASHEAAKKLNEAKSYEGPDKYDPQQAKQTVMLLESIGLLEKAEPEAIQFKDSKDNIYLDDEAIYLDKWKMTSVQMQ